jgi:hypothetical protein
MKTLIKLKLGRTFLKKPDMVADYLNPGTSEAEAGES